MFRPFVPLDCLWIARIPHTPNTCRQPLPILHQVYIVDHPRGPSAPCLVWKVCAVKRGVGSDAQQGVVALWGTSSSPFHCRVRSFQSVFWSKKIIKQNSEIAPIGVHIIITNA